MSYLFGSISYVSRSDLLVMVIVDVLLVGLLAIFQKRLVAVCIDEDYASLQRARVVAVNALLLVLVALATICLARVVGLILVLAMLTLPAATAGHWCLRLPAMMLFSVLLGSFLMTLPRIAVYGSRLSPESSIVLSAAGAYVISLVLRAIRPSPPESSQERSGPRTSAGSAGIQG